jgi:hypothetical protein
MEHVKASLSKEYKQYFKFLLNNTYCVIQSSCTEKKTLYLQGIINQSVREHVPSSLYPITFLFVCVHSFALLLWFPWASPNHSQPSHHNRIDNNYKITPATPRCDTAPSMCFGTTRLVRRALSVLACLNLSFCCGLQKDAQN